MKAHSFNRVMRRFGRVVGLPVALFVFFASVLTNIGNVMKPAQDTQDMASANEVGAKQPYESPSFAVFSGIFTSDAYATEEISS